MQRAHLPFYPDHHVAGRHRSSKRTVKARSIRAALASREKAHRPAKAPLIEFRQRAGRTPGRWLCLSDLDKQNHLWDVKIMRLVGGRHTRFQRMATRVKARRLPGWAG